MSALERRVRASDIPAWSDAAGALYRAAQAVAGPGGAGAMAQLVQQLAQILDAATVFVAVHAGDSPRRMRTLAAVLDGKVLRNFDYALEGSPCAQVVDHGFRYVARGVAAEFAHDTIFAAKGMDSYAAYPLDDSEGRPLGLLVAMDRRPIADATLTEALLKIFASRIVAEIERSRADDALRATALAVSSARGDSVFAELSRYLATILHCEIAFIARLEPHDTESLRVLAMFDDGRITVDSRYPIAGTPCETVLGQTFRAYPDQLQRLFPDDLDAKVQSVQGYAGHPLVALDGTPLGIVAVASRRPLAQVERTEAMLQIFAARAAAEIERLAASEAQQRSEASYRAIFEASEDAIFVHDWNTGAVLDVNPKACEVWGGSRDALCRLSLAELNDGVEPYSAEGWLERIAQARIGRCPPFEWQRRNRDGKLRWDVVHLKPVTISGRQHIVAFTRDITERKAAVQELRAREEQYRVIFDGSADALVLWDQDIRCVDVNPAFTRLFGYERAEAIGGTFPRRFGEEAIRLRLQCIRAALDGEESSLETRAVRRDGSSFDVEVRYLPIRYGGVPHVLSIGRDITERKAALAALQAQEEQYRAIFDGSVDSMVLWSRDLRTVDVNQAFVRMTGMSREQVIGKHWSERPDARDMQRLIGFIEAALQGREMQAVEPVTRADGSSFHIELRYLPVRLGDTPYVLGVGRDVSERLEAERALRASEAQYRGIFNASADALVLRAADFSIVDANATYERMSGYALAEVLGVDRVLANPPEVMATIRALHERALAGETITLETQLVRRDGKRYDLELRGVPIQHRGAPHVLYIGRDMTQSRRAERALRDSEEQYRAIFNASADGLVLRDADYRVVDVNPAYLAMSGFTRDEVISATRVLTQTDEAMQRRHRRQHADVLAGRAMRYDVTGTRKDGTLFHAEVSAMPVTYRGNPHVLYAARDITERKAAADALRMREQQYRAIFDGSADAMVLWNSEIRFVDVNRAYTQMYGFTRDEVIGTTLDGRLPEAMVAERTACMRAALAGKERVIETTTLRKNGEPFDVELRYLPIVHLGEPHVLAIARDITGRLAAEAERERLEAQLRQAQKMEAIGQLTGGIAHDFNNILTSVIGYLVLAQERAGPLGDAHLQRQLGQAHLAAQRARELIAQMLAFARRQHGERRVLALAPLVGQSLQLLRATLPSSVSVDFIAPPAVGGENLHVAADAVQLEQVLFNLCINARDAITGSGWIRVRLGRHDGAWSCASCRAHAGAGRWVEISVADSGCGIEPALLERIFEPFTSTKEVGRGSGMGLAMVHGIVHDHGGHVLVETTPGAGSVFRVLLPPASSAAEADSEVRVESAGNVPMRGRVMVVEDEAMVGDFMAELLSGWGLDVVLQRAPLAALAWLEDEHEALDLLITDQTMPRLEGLQLAERAIALRPRLPVLLYTGNADAIDDAEAKRRGVCGVLRKPVDGEALRTLVGRCLEAGRAGA